MTWWADSTMEHGCATFSSFSCVWTRRGPKFVVLNATICVTLPSQGENLQYPRPKPFNGNVKYYKFGSSSGSVRMQMLPKHVPSCYPPTRSYCHTATRVSQELPPDTPWGGFDPSHHPPLLFWAPPGDYRSEPVGPGLWNRDSHNSK